MLGSIRGSFLRETSSRLAETEKLGLRQSEVDNKKETNQSPRNVCPGEGLGVCQHEPRSRMENHREGQLKQNPETPEG